MHPFKKVPPALWAFIFTNNACPMSVVLPDGHFLEVNDAFCQLTQRSRNDLLGLRFQDITRPEDLDADVARADRVRRGECRSYQMVKAYVSPTNENIWCRLGVQGIYQDGVLVCFLAVAIPVQAPTEQTAAVLSTTAGAVSWWKANWATLLPYIIAMILASYVWFAEWRDIKRDRDIILKKLEEIERERKQPK